MGRKSRGKDPLLPSSKGMLSPFGAIMLSVLGAAFLLAAWLSNMSPMVVLIVNIAAAGFILQFVLDAGGVKFKLPKRKEKERFTPVSVKKEKKVKEAPHRDKFYSEAHPGIYNLAKSFLPRLHLIIFAGYVLYAMYWEMMRGNSDFMLDWFETSPLPGLLHVLSSGDNFNAWLNQYGVIFTIIMLIVFICLVTFYYTFWRLAFKDYYKFSEGSRRYEGRCYWRTNNSLLQWWDRKYGSPPRQQNSYWLKIGWWPPLSLINPTNSLIRLDTTLGERCEQRGVYIISVREYPLRRKVENDPKHWATVPGSYENGVIPNQYAEDYFTLRSKVLVDDTTDLSFGNADTRNSVMQDGLRLSKPSIRRYIIAERERKQDNH